MTGYHVDIDVVMSLAQNSYSAAEQYAQILTKITRTDGAAPHLADKDGVATGADSDVVSMIDEFYEYLKTTTARYQLVGEQLEETARTYVANENDQQEVYDRYMTDFDSYDVGESDLGINPGKESSDTDRPDEATGAQADGFGTDENPADNVEGGSAYLDEIEPEPKPEQEN